MNIRKRFEDYTEADYDRILDVHMKGMFFMAQAVYPRWRRAAAAASSTLPRSAG